MINTRKCLVIIGAGGHGKVVADVARRMGCYGTIFFLDDDSSVKECSGFSVVGKSNEIGRYIKEYDVFVAVGNAATRGRIMDELKAAGAFLPVLIHPDAVVGQGVMVGDGTVVMAGAVINPDTQVGDGCIINTCSSVDHDCRIGDYVHVSVGAHVAGGVSIGKNSWIGAGAVIRNQICIAKDCMIGAGAVVVKNIEAGGTYIGVPARKMA